MRTACVVRRRLPSILCRNSSPTTAATATRPRKRQSRRRHTACLQAASLTPSRRSALEYSFSLSAASRTVPRISAASSYYCASTQRLQNQLPARPIHRRSHLDLYSLPGSSSRCAQRPHRWMPPDDLPDDDLRDGAKPGSPKCAGRCSSPHPRPPPGSSPRSIVFRSSRTFPRPVVRDSSRFSKLS